MGGLEKNKYIKMPAGKMKIQTNALIRDAETLLENVSRRWLLATAAAAAARGHSVRKQQKGEDWGEEDFRWRRPWYVRL